MLSLKKLLAIKCKRLASLLILTCSLFSSFLFANQLTETQWQQDIDKLLLKVRTIHPNPWRSISEKKFKQQLQTIVKNAQHQTQQQTVVELIKAVSVITQAGSDGQSKIWPLQQATNLHLLPIQLFWFSNGIYIIDTDTKNAALKGRRLTAIAGVPIKQILDKVRPFISVGNETGAKQWTPLYAIIPEILESLSIAKGLTLTVSTQTANGLVKSEIKAISADVYQNLFPLKNFKQDFAFKRLDYDTLYLEYNRMVHEDNNGQSFYDFIDQVEIEIKQYQLTNIIIDLRNNSGGEQKVYGGFFEMYNRLKKQRLNIEIYILAGRATASSAVTFISDLEHKTNAILIGEPTGGMLEHFDRPVAITLPNSKLNVQLASEFLIKPSITQPSSSSQPLYKQPSYTVPLKSRNYFSNQDKVLTKAMDLIELKSYDD